MEPIEAYHLRLDFTNNTVTIKYNPKLMLAPYGNELDADSYQSTLEHLKRRIDWCVIKSAGQEPNLDDYHVCNR